MPKPQPSKDKFWEELEALLVEKKPGPEWFLTTDIQKSLGLSHSHTCRVLKSKVDAGLLEVRKTSRGSSHACYYRVKK